MFLIGFDQPHFRGPNLIINPGAVIIPSSSSLSSSCDKIPRCFVSVYLSSVRLKKSTLDVKSK
jgi:hypothetical protein